MDQICRQLDQIISEIRLLREQTTAVCCIIAGQSGNREVPNTDLM